MNLSNFFSLIFVMVTGFLVTLIIAFGILSLWSIAVLVTIREFFPETCLSILTFPQILVSLFVGTTLISNVLGIDRIKKEETDENFEAISSLVMKFLAPFLAIGVVYLVKLFA